MVNILDRLDETSRITPTCRFSNDDMVGIDMFVETDEDVIGTILTLKVQVVSSGSGVESWKHEKAFHKHINPKKIDYWLIKNRFIVLNGCAPEEEIKQNFQNQLKEIINWEKRRLQIKVPARVVNS